MAEWGATGFTEPAESSADWGWLSVGLPRRIARGAVLLLLAGALPATHLPPDWLLPAAAVVLFVAGLDVGPVPSLLFAVVAGVAALLVHRPQSPSLALALVLVPLLAAVAGSAVGYRVRRVRQAAMGAARRARLLSEALLRLPRLETADDVFRELPHLLQEILGFSHADVLVPAQDGQHLQVHTTLGWTPPSGVLVPLQSITGRALRTRRSQHVPNTQADPEFVQGVGITATHSELALPILSGDQAVAVLNVERGNPGAFLPDEVETLEALVRAGGDAVWRLGRLSATQETTRLQNFLLDFSRQITQLPTPQGVAQRALQLLLPFAAADVGSLWLPGGEAPHLLARQSLGDFESPAAASPLETSFRGQIPRQAFWVASAVTSPYTTARQLDLGLQSFALLPLMEPDGRPQAALEFLFYRTPAGFGVGERQALERAADRLRIALQGILATSRLTELLASLHALGAIGDMQALCDEALAEAIRLIPAADAATLWLANGTHLDLRAVAGYDDPSAQGHWRLQEVEGAIAVYGGERSAFLNGLPRIVTRPESATQEGQPHGAAASIFVPLVLHGDLIGLLSIDNLTEPDAFSQEALSLAGMFGLQLAVLLAQGRHLSALRIAARTDTLTDLGNRRAFEERMVSAWSEAVRYREPLALVIMDLQGFKAINDQFGHLSGDEALTAVARVLDGVRREGDTVFRWGGDEFAILLTHADQGQALQAARRYLDAVRQGPVLVRQGREVYVGARVGVASAPEDADSIEGLVRAADERVIMAKRLGQSLWAGDPPRS